VGDADTRAARGPVRAFAAGGLIGTLGGLIGLGGAEFRLPLLVGPFRFPPLEAIILNKAMSLIVVATALLFRSGTISFAEIAAHWPIMINLLAGSIAGAWFGAGWATRISAGALHRIIGILLVLIALVLAFGHDLIGGHPIFADAMLRIAVGVIAGFAIGVVASLFGVAGGELLIPTLIMLFGLDVKLAGSLSLAISLPTMITGFARYSRDRSFTVIGRHRNFVLVMALGSIVGGMIGGMLLGIVPERVLLPMLAAILIISAVKMLTAKPH
jgi:uncharacterized membrane protein YfcA